MGAGQAPRRVFLHRRIICDLSIAFADKEVGDQDSPGKQRQIGDLRPRERARGAGALEAFFRHIRFPR
jgi:hypothetical protein